MHPEAAAEAQREIVVGAAARRNRRPGDAGNAVLLPWRGETVPMDQTRLLERVFHADAEPIAHLRSDAEGAVGLPDAQHRRGLAVHLDAAACNPQHRRWRAARAR